MHYRSGIVEDAEQTFYALRQIKTNYIQCLNKRIETKIKQQKIQDLLIETRLLLNLSTNPTG